MAATAGGGLIHEHHITAPSCAAYCWALLPTPCVRRLSLVASSSQLP